MTNILPELVDKSISECLIIAAKELRDKNTPTGLTLSNSTIDELVKLLESIAHYIESYCDD